jgi:hypothetical protein
LNLIKKFNPDIIPLLENTHKYIYPSDENLPYLNILDCFGRALYFLDNIECVIPSKYEFLIMKDNFIEEAMTLLLKHQMDLPLFTAINSAIKSVQLYFIEQRALCK